MQAHLSVDEPVFAKAKLWLLRASFERRHERRFVNAMV